MLLGFCFICVENYLVQIPCVCVLFICFCELQFLCFRFTTVSRGLCWIRVWTYLLQVGLFWHRQIFLTEINMHICRSNMNYGRLVFVEKYNVNLTLNWLSFSSVPTNETIFIFTFKQSQQCRHTWTANQFKIRRRTVFIDIEKWNCSCQFHLKQQLEEYLLLECCVQITLENNW